MTIFQNLKYRIKFEMINVKNRYFELKEFLITDSEKNREITNSSIICENKLHKQSEYLLIRYLGFKNVKTDFKNLSEQFFFFRILIANFNLSDRFSNN